MRDGENTSGRTAEWVVGRRASSGRLVINYQGCHNDLVCATAERERARDDEFGADTEGWLVGRLPACLPDDDALCAGVRDKKCCSSCARLYLAIAKICWESPPPPSACVLTKAIVCRAGFARASFAEKKQLASFVLTAALTHIHSLRWVARLMIKLA